MIKAEEAQSGSKGFLNHCVTSEPTSARVGNMGRNFEEIEVHIQKSQVQMRNFPKSGEVGSLLVLFSLSTQTKSVTKVHDTRPDERLGAPSSGLLCCTRCKAGTPESLICWCAKQVSSAVLYLVQNKFHLVHYTWCKIVGFYPLCCTWCKISAVPVRVECVV